MPRENRQLQDDPASLDIQLAGGIKTAIFGGEGLFLATLTGPAGCIVGTLTPGPVRRGRGWGRQGGEERNPRRAIGELADIFSNED